MVHIHFVRSPEVDESIRNKGFTIYDSGDTERNGLVEVPVGAEHRLVRDLRADGADPKVQPVRVDIPEEVVEADIVRLVACVVKMGYQIKREGTLIMVDHRAASVVRTRLNDVAVATRNGREATFVGA